MAKGLTTTVLHADRQAEIEHGAVHKPMHAAVAYGYRSSRDLAAVFQGDKPGHVYGRQGNPTTSALETKISLMDEAIYLNALGLVCALGDDVPAVRAALFDTMAPKVACSDTIIPGKSWPVAPVTSALASLATLPEPLRSRNNALLLGALTQIRDVVDAEHLHGTSGVA